ncbi:hypothetical protein AGR56_05420 [Clostridium sp. DMHC 10]|uniref:hypothetical protein n=1 Tax=Clostridium sp. DMHC 10 TaxID=747377 RepID=UPI00069EA673|nr:hypothetical protein [Clostridium sp. DMHC 10]KOF56290.1 hypothetical protein AGR56_05420 [Clostridium sp. DMHC 10]
MPRLTKIRIVGNKYDNFKKCHDNSIFDLTKMGEPDHTLFTLNNGSGKGVLMQLISQIMLPNTRWGKNDGNKIAGMFLNRNNQFKPYTFHVLLEWKLDTMPDRWLMTGICITAVKKLDNKEEEKEEEKIGVKYFLYTHEHYVDDPYIVENIPLYLKDERKAVSYKALEEFLGDNKRDFRKFSESDSRSTNSEYYQYLAGLGIYRSEWSILKLINKVEGGVGEYFSKAKDNKGIFDEYIIPAISENLNSQFEENKNVLKDMFKSNISITKNLPILINREVDYKNISSLLDPLIRDAEQGIIYEDKKNSCIINGNNLYCSLNSIQNNVLNEIETWEKEKSKAETRKRELLFEKDNLEYAKQIRAKKDYEGNKAFEQKEFDYINSEIDDLNEEKKKYEINKLIIPMEKDEYKKKSTLEEIEKLMNSLALKDVHGEMNKVEEEIKDKWKITQEKWSNISSQYKAYEAFLNNKEAKLKVEIKSLNEKKQSIQVNLKAIEDKKKEFNKKEKELGTEFDPFRIVYPELLLEDIKKEKEEEDKKLLTLNSKCEKLEEKINSLKLKIAEFKMKLEQYGDSKKDITKKYNEKKEEEEKLFARVLEVCKLDPLMETYSENWLQNKAFEVKKLKEEKELQEKKLYKELWENSIDLSLNTEEYWIANNDVNSVKDKIEALGIKVIYGTQFLYALHEEQKKNMLSNYPMLPFGLVISNVNEWKTIESNIDKESFLRALVPIYVRTEMNKVESVNYKLVDHKALKFVEDYDSYVSWKESLSKKELEAKETIRVVEGSIEKIGELLNAISLALKTESSAALDQKLKQIELNINENLSEISAAETGINNSTEKLNINKKNRENVDENIKKLSYQIEKLVNFIEFKNKIDKKLKEEKEAMQELNNLVSKLSEKELEKELLDKNINDENLNYERWKVKLVEPGLKDIREVVKEAEFKEINPKDNLQCSTAPNYEASKKDEIYSSISYRKSLNTKLESKNNSIALLKKNAEDIQENIDRQIKMLKKIDLNWKNYKVENISLEFAEMEFDNLAKKIKLKEKLAKEKSQSISKLEGLIEAVIKDIEKQANKILEEHQKAANVWENLNLEEKEFKIKSGIEDNSKYLARTENILKALEVRKANINNCISEIKYFEIDPLKGKTSEYDMNKIKDNEKNEVDKWIQDFKNIDQSIKNHTTNAEENFEVFLEALKNDIKDEILKHKIKEIIGDKTNIGNFTSNKDSFKSMKEHAEREINQIKTDKLEAEEAKEQWVSRAARQAIKISECLKEMVNKMVYVNENNYAFKLVRLKGEELLPKEESDINILLNEYFIECIEKLEKKDADFDNLDNKELNELMSDKKIFSKALRGKYPSLEVYKMSEKNEFLYAKPQDYHYATWGAVNSGEGDSPEGSGGQTLSINTFIIMMLMNYKKRTLGNENPWTVLMLDNPFGKASGAHVLDPIFTIANKLNFQIIAFAAPEIIKTEISERFPVFWALKINNEEEDGNLGNVVGRVVHGGRVRG